MSKTTIWKDGSYIIEENITPSWTEEEKKEFQEEVLRFAQNLYREGTSIKDLRTMFRHGINIGVLAGLEDFFTMMEALE